MQIDFHHTVTYVTARLAKFSMQDANIISHSAQYVDDAVNSGSIKFRNKAMYSRISSAHKMLDYRNFEELANHFTWVPFHFLPGNGGKRAGDNPDGSFVNKLVCYPDSYVAEDMMKSCIDCHDLPYGLHRLGITMHVLADTFAHQGFAGINHQINEVEGLKKKDDDNTTLLDKVANYFAHCFNRETSKIINDAFPLGHGAVLAFPDLPYLKWQYKNGFGKEIVRDNTKIFMDAVKRMHQAMVCFRMKDPDYTLEDWDEIPAKDLNKIEENFRAFEDEEGEDRHMKWLKSIAAGDFSFAEKGEENLSYIHNGKDSWKYKALKTKRESETKHELFPFSPEFLRSDWKLFHDALQIHRIDIIRDILPKYGICVA
ncbi:DUF6765 family protein [Desulfobacula toluolica]|uniref:Conserved uncharacterized protein n=1 Tax=Desulfobacula toluolica (strain DSM 7467 / Tol2) TaxID=651182 RepID=K0NN28_DESTT|nr:DUF6765 family protein [Desulfobacula toluolica]CCK81413.1 conserved uncharacterized protein [Desulfobacula toluolica Tol2]